MASASNTTGTTLDGREVLVISTNYGTESDELTQPIETLRSAGAQVTVAAVENRPVRTLVADKDPGPEVPVDTTLAVAEAADYDALVVPGGTLNADQLRADSNARKIIADFAQAGKPVAAICHGPWLLIDAGLASGKKLTSYSSLGIDLENAGATWVDQQVVLDTSAGFPLITSRNPGDLEAFTGELVQQLSGGA
ncbi:type 1 glutamine amidotransferase domain-containing protein [Zhihengliuella halotolerans]|uniref:type 1 glutamine amidotransferase domain-containing protein n=1 Tax=Zhihengliuella halotolerans TaxID=370736 RepID=UPI000C808366|nr:type 1 glutamine amidotransferase domain-containing protein [Zhihengliuella halotolerans]